MHVLTSALVTSVAFIINRHIHTDEKQRTVTFIKQIEGPRASGKIIKQDWQFPEWGISYALNYSMGNVELFLFSFNLIVSLVL